MQDYRSFYFYLFSVFSNFLTIELNHYKREQRYEVLVEVVKSCFRDVTDEVSADTKQALPSRLMTLGLGKRMKRIGKPM